MRFNAYKPTQRIVAQDQGGAINTFLRSIQAGRCLIREDKKNNKKKTVLNSLYSFLLCFGFIRNYLFDLL
jgi:hypothetical protein